MTIILLVFVAAGGMAFGAVLAAMLLVDITALIEDWLHSRR